MKLSYKSVLKWIDTYAANDCTHNELETLDEALTDAKREHSQRQRASEHALAKLNELAIASGYPSAAALLAATGQGSNAAGPSTKHERAFKSRPHMNPFDPESEAYSLSKMKPENYPQWAKDLVGQGWTLNELKVQNIEEALQRRNLKPAYDIVARHKKLNPRD